MSQYVVMLSLCSVDTLSYLHSFWTIFTAPFFPLGTLDPFMVIFTLFVVYTLLTALPEVEKGAGSVLAAWFVFTTCVVINCLFLLLTFSLSRLVPAIFDDVSGQYVNGLWPFVMYLITTRCLKNPSGSVSFWGVVDVPNKWLEITVFSP